MLDCGTDLQCGLPLSPLLNMGLEAEATGKRLGGVQPARHNLRHCPPGILRILCWQEGRPCMRKLLSHPARQAEAIADSSCLRSYLRSEARWLQTVIKQCCVCRPSQAFHSLGLALRLTTVTMMASDFTGTPQDR